MTRSRPITFLASAAAVALAALTVAACGGGGGEGATAAAPKSTGGQTATVGVATTGLGKILVDAKGRSLYLFEADRPNVSNCSGACLSLWPAFTSHGKPQAQGGALAAKIGTIATTGGKQQVTYNGHPLYYYAADQKPGDTTGQGLDQFGAEWYVLATSGNKIDND